MYCFWVRLLSRKWKWNGRLISIAGPDWTRAGPQRLRGLVRSFLTKFGQHLSAPSCWIYKGQLETLGRTGVVDRVWPSGRTRSTQWPSRAGLLFLSRSSMCVWGGCAHWGEPLWRTWRKEPSDLTGPAELDQGDGQNKIYFSLHYFKIFIYINL